MKAYEISSKNDNLSYFPPDGLLALFDRSAPLSVREEIIGRIAGGEKPTAAEFEDAPATLQQPTRKLPNRPNRQPFRHR